VALGKVAMRIILPPLLTVTTSRQSSLRRFEALSEGWNCEWGKQEGGGVDIVPLHDRAGWEMFKEVRRTAGAENV